MVSIPTADQPFVFSPSALPHGSAVSLADDLVQRTRHEITAILREIADLSRQPVGFNAYFATVLDQLVVALGAKGAVLWNTGRETPSALVRTGLFTDADLPLDATATHDRLLLEVKESASPVVVPSTPAVKDPHLPSNPTAYPVALVPLVHTHAEGELAPDDRYVLEVFLEPEGGVATQRGYLRFITQVTDYAAEFLQLDELRRLRHKTHWSQQADESIDRILKLQSFTATAAMIVDEATGLFGVARATLVTLPAFAQAPKTCQLMAVSHVDSIDQRGPGADELRRLVIASLNGQPATAPEKALGVARLIRSADGRLGLFLQATEECLAAADQTGELERWSTRALSIAQSHLRLESLPLARWYLAWSPQWHQVAPTFVRRFMVVVAIMVALTMAALIPTPLVIELPATLRADGTRVIFSPADAVIEQTPVKHGQAVQRGDLLVKLRDWQLDERFATLTARRALISQRLNRSVSSLVERPSAQSYSSDRTSESDEELVQQQRLFEEELIGIDEQLAILQVAMQRLEIRAELDGFVDAWQLESIAIGRPVQRGEALMRVIPQHTHWIAEAEVEQSRLSAVRDHLRQSTAEGLQIAALSEPQIKYPARFTGRAAVALSIDPHRSSSASSSAHQWLEFAMVAESNETQDQTSPNWPYGTPALVTVDCGRFPLVEVAFYDLIRAAQRTFARWI